jgi:hypothetical protein
MILQLDIQYADISPISVSGLKGNDTKLIRCKRPHHRQFARAIFMNTHASLTIHDQGNLVAGMAIESPGK